MRKMFLLLAVLTLALVGAVGAANAKLVERPFRATYSGMTTDIHWAPGIDLQTNPWVTDDFGGRCPDGASWMIEFGGTGRATTLGQFSWTSSHCTRLTQLDPVPNAVLSDGQFEYVTSNGDVLKETYEAVGGLVLEGDLLCADTQATFAGGTGRFTTASGTALEHGCWPADTVGPVLDDLQVTSEGTLAFDASQRP